MKKTFIVLLGVLFVLGMAAAAFAVHPSAPAEMVTVGAKGKTQIVLGGSLRFRGDTRHRIPSLGSDVVDYLVESSDSDLAADRQTYGSLHKVLENLGLINDPSEHRAFYDGRVRLWLDAYVSDNTMGRIHLETGWDDDEDGYNWGCDDQSDWSGLESVIGDNDGDDRNPDTSGVYGEGNCKAKPLQVLEAFIKHEGSGLLGIPAGIKIGHFPITLGRGLFLLHNRFGDDVINVFMDPTDNLHIELAHIKFTEGNVTNADDDTDTYSLIVNYKGDNFNVGGDVTYLRDKDELSREGTDLWNIGVRGDIDVGVNIYADVEWQDGEAKDVQLAHRPLGSLDDIDFTGWAVLVGATATIPAPAINVNAEFGMGSGDDDLNDTDFETFVTSLSGVKKYTYVYDYRVVTAALGTNTGIANTTYVKLGASGQPSPDVKAALDFYWLSATEDVLGEDDLGYELDGKVSYKIDTNLEYFIEGGILFAGDFYDVFDPDEDADDPWVVRHGIQLGF